MNLNGDFNVRSEKELYRKKFTYTPIQDSNNVKLCLYIRKNLFLRQASFRGRELLKGAVARQYRTFEKFKNNKSKIRLLYQYEKFKLILRISILRFLIFVPPGTLSAYVTVTYVKFE